MTCVRMFAAAGLLLGMMINASSAEERYTKISCDDLGQIAKDCNACYDGGLKEVGEAFTPDLIFSAGAQSRVVFEEENQTRFAFDVLNDETDWSYTSDLIGYPSTWLWDTASDGVRRYRLIESDTSVRIYATKTDAGIVLNAANGEAGSAGNYDARLTLIVSLRDFLGAGQAGDLYEVNHCVFYAAAR